MRVLIVGGGIAGLCLARALELHGITADLIERQSGKPAGGAGLYLPGNATRALERLGLLAQVAQVAAPIAEQRILNRHGGILTSTITETFWRGCGPCLSLPRNTLHEILRGSLIRTKINLGRSIAAISQSGSGCDVNFEDGATGHYDIVVGADGVNSRVRQLAITAAPPVYVGNICWRFITQNSVNIGCWTAMLSGRCTLLAIPVSPTDVYVYADMLVPAGDIERFSERSDIGAIFADFNAPLRLLIEKRSPDTEVHFGRIEQVRLPSWVNGRVVLIGDAAHASSPNMAEGAGMGMEDALVLAEEITGKRELNAALEAFSARRKSRVNWVQKQCAAREKLRRLPGLLRIAVLATLGSGLYRKAYTPLLAPF